MDFTHYRDESVQTAADLVNTRGHPSGTDYMDTPEKARNFLVEHGFSRVAEVSAADLAELHDVRARLDEVFYAPDEETAAALINQLLRDLDLGPYLTKHDGRWHFHYAPDSALPGHRVAASAVMGLAAVIAEYGFGRLGICSADDCGDVFVDTSRNRSRRYCNDLCSTRMNVAAYRARAKAGSRSRGAHRASET
ncbi:CGNR zinc finger domain-containing protein [soil metagenome]